jgi:hypothetical protein
MKKHITVSHQEVCELVCDGCGLEASVDEGYEFSEFISIEHRCGYGAFMMMASSYQLICVSTVSQACAVMF